VLIATTPPLPSSSWHERLRSANLTKPSSSLNSSTSLTIESASQQHQEPYGGWAHPDVVAPDTIRHFTEFTWPCTLRYYLNEDGEEFQKLVPFITHLSSDGFEM